MKFIESHLSELEYISSPKKPEVTLLPEDVMVKNGLTDDQIDQLVAFSTDPSDEDLLNNTRDDTRFNSSKAVKEWLDEDRSVSVLVNSKDDLLGIIWYRAGDMPLEEGETLHTINPSQYGITMGIRIYGPARGRKLSIPLTILGEAQFQQTESYQKLVEDGKANPWLEVQSDNIYGIKSYIKSGYQIVTEPNEKGKIFMVKKPKPTTVFQK